MTHFLKRFPTTFRAAAAGLAMVACLAALPITAHAAPTAAQVQSAKDKVARLTKDIQAAYAQLNKDKAAANQVADEMYQAQTALDQATSQYLATKKQYDEAKAQFDQITAQLDSRTRAAFMEGPGSGLEFLLGSTTLADLSDRMAYVDALAQNDADLATQAQNLKTQLAATAAQEQKLRNQRLAAYDKWKQKNDLVQQNLQQQQSLVDEIARKKAEATKLASKLSKQYQQSILGQTYPPTYGGPPPPGFIGVFKHCPVGDPKALTDSFGAPRYAGGYHLHMGNDIMAPSGVPIYAPFDGTSREVPNTLGGLAVIVQGANGWVYNAHLSSYGPGATGSVSAGDVVGYVGDSGDAAGGPPHDHFEFHPSVIPSSWPQSPYGYSVIGDAINPYPLLVAAC